VITLPFFEGGAGPADESPDFRTHHLIGVRDGAAAVGLSDFLSEVRMPSVGLVEEGLPAPGEILSGRAGRVGVQIPFDLLDQIRPFFLVGLHLTGSVAPADLLEFLHLFGGEKLFRPIFFLLFAHLNLLDDHDDLIEVHFFAFFQLSQNLLESASRPL